MEYTKDLNWKRNITLKELMKGLGKVGFQSIELARASEIIVKMKKNNAKIFFTFTSNMVTSGLRGFFSQVIKLGMADFIVTTTGGIEEDIMKAIGEKFLISSFYVNDVKLHEEGKNRVGNLLIDNESYCRFEDYITLILNELYKKKNSYSVSEMLYEIGLKLKDENSILYQAAKKKIPIYCPAITDGALGFHLYLFKQKHNDFNVDIIDDFKRIITEIGFDDKKGLISLGGGVSKHHAILASLLNGGLDYAVYMTTSQASSGSMSGANTNEAKSWGKIKDNSDAVTVIGEVSITFPLAMMNAFEILSDEGIIEASLEKNLQEKKTTDENERS